MEICYRKHNKNANKRRRWIRSNSSEERVRVRRRGRKESLRHEMRPYSKNTTPNPARTTNRLTARQELSKNVLQSVSALIAEQLRDLRVVRVHRTDRLTHTPHITTPHDGLSARRRRRRRVRVNGEWRDVQTCEKF